MQESIAFPRKNFLARILPRQGKMRVPVTIYSSALLAPTLSEIRGLEQMAALKRVEQVVALPDLHMKPRLETPSSTAAAARDAVILSLSSPSPGCGMALALTSLSEADLTPARLDAFFDEVRAQLPLHRPAGDLLVSDVRPFLLGGAAAALDHFGLDPALLHSIEKQGNVLTALALALEADPQQALNSIPEPFLQRAGIEFGYIGRGNHFLELQVVEKILNPEVAAGWGVQEGQVVSMYHADSGRLGSFTGRLYAYRMKNNWRGRMIEMWYKAPFHFSQTRSIQDAYRRMSYYFAPRRHTVMPVSSKFARQAVWGLGMAANYAFANRIAIFSILQQILRQVWDQDESAALLYDVSHNSIGPEDLHGDRLWVHRHNASRALPPHHPALRGSSFAGTGQPVLLPGTNRTVSYLCAAQPGVEKSLFSIDHGAGRSAARLGVPHPQPVGNTRLYDYGQGYVTDLAHLTNDGIDEVLNVLIHSDLARPVARLRPVATLKDCSR